MPAPMWMFAQIAAEHGVDPDDDEAVDVFFEDTLGTLPKAERQVILTRLIEHDVKKPSGD